MISPSEIRDKAERKYTAFLKAWLLGESIFPLRIQGRLASGSTPWSELSAWIKVLNAGSKAEKGHGYRVQFGEPVATRLHGKQTLPEAILIDTQSDFLLFIQKTKEFLIFKADVAYLRLVLPQLGDWMLAHPQAVIDHAANWTDLVATCNFFLQNPRSGHYIRELPVQVHSKFIENNKGILRDLLDHLLDEEHVLADVNTFEDRFGLRKPPITVRFRVLDPALRDALALPSGDLSLPLEDFSKLPFHQPNVIVSENLMPFLAMPFVANGICIFGEGNAVSALVAPWLHDAAILYWGDLDIQGFRFLANLRKRYAQTRSIFMNSATLEKYHEFSTQGVADGNANPLGLTSEEWEAFAVLKKENLRLEQERVTHLDLVKMLPNFGLVL